MNYDADAFFDDLDCFATVATRGDSGARLVGYFDAAFADPAGVLSSAPQFTCKSSDAAGLRVGAALTHAGEEYRITSIEPDGTGVTVLRLSRN